MTISPRLSRIFRILLDLDPGQSISITEMAARIRISRRTLFRELESARLVLDQCDMQLATKPGVHLQGDPTKLQALLAKEEIGALNREERQDMLLYELLRGEGGQKLVVYASKFQVSEATISHDLEDIKKRLSPYNLKLKKNGIISGDEEDRRKVMSMLVREGVEYKAVDYLDPNALLEQVFQGSAILSLLDQDLLKRVLTLIAQNREELGFSRFEQNSYIGLIIHLVIALERLQKGEPTLERMSDIEQESVWGQARQLTRLLEKEFHVEFPDAEIDSIALHLRGAKMNVADGSLSEEQVEVIDLARGFVEGFPIRQASVLSTDGQFIQGLISHLEPTIIRLRSHLPIYNPLLETLKEQYGELFALTKSAAQSIEQALSLPLSEEEIGFLTMHVGASLERSQQSHRKIHVAVVCASGIGVSSLLCARLEKAFLGQMELENLSVAQARERNDIELFITTFKTGWLPGVTLQVSPMLPKKDLERIQEHLHPLQRKPVPLASRASGLEHELLQMEEGFHAARLLCARIPIVHTSATTSEQLIHEASLSLQGDCRQLEADLWKREQLGPVVALEEAFGLFHALSSGTDQPQAALLVPKQGSFHDGLKAMLVTVLPLQHSKGMQEVLSFLNSSLAQNEEFRHCILNGDDENRQAAFQGVLVQYIHDLMDRFTF